MTPGERRAVLEQLGQVEAELTRCTGELRERIGDLEATFVGIRRRPGTESLCPDCQGTCWVSDDGSLSGTPGTPMPCICCEPRYRDEWRTGPPLGCVPVPAARR